MCMSRLHKVRRSVGAGTVESEDMDGNVHMVSLLALEGPVPEPGDWLVVHSGYAIDRADALESETIALELAHVRTSAAGGSGREGEA